MKSISKGIKVQSTLNAAVYGASTTAGTGIDTKGYDSIELIANVGTAGITWDGTNFLGLVVQESADNSAWNDVAEADLDGAVSGTTTGRFALLNDATDDEQTYKVGYTGGKRYIRGSLIVDGTHSTGTPISISSILSNPTYGPAS